MELSAPWHIGFVTALCTGVGRLFEVRDAIVDSRFFLCLGLGTKLFTRQEYEQLLGIMPSRLSIYCVLCQGVWKMIPCQMIEILSCELS